MEAILKKVKMIRTEFNNTIGTVISHKSAINARPLSGLLKWTERRATAASSILVQRGNH